MKFGRKSRYVNLNHTLISKRTSFAERDHFAENGCNIDGIKALPVDRSVENVNNPAKESLQVKLLLTLSYEENDRKGFGLTCIYTDDFTIDGKGNL